MIIDISPAITPELRVFPGDTPMSREVLMRLEEGHSVTLSTLHTTVHLGAHADGVNHYSVDGSSIDQIPLDRYIGPCQVIHARVEGPVVTCADIDVERVTESRVLLRTDTYPDPMTWTDDFAALDPDLIRALAQRGVTTIGVDTPSVDRATSKDLPAHATFAETGVVIIEGLVLKDVAPGRYELIALPLKLVDFDGSPVRAVLRHMH